MSSKLVDAAHKNDVTTIRKCLEAGEDVNEGNPLWWAGARGCTDAARLLIEWGADISAKTSGYTAYKMAKDSGHGATADFIAAATQQPRKVPAPTGPVEKWVAMGAASVAFVGIYPELDKKLSQTFNFQTRERVILSENLAGGAAAVGPSTSFDDLPPQAVETALDEFTRRGGAADRDYVLQGNTSLGKQKMPAKIEAPHG